MPGKRATTPLFEVLQDRQAAARAEARPEIAPEPAPRSPEPADTRRPAQQPAPPGGFTDAPIRIVGGVVQMPLVYAAATLALAIAMVLGAWTLGFKRGETQATTRQQLLETALGPEARITEPGTQPGTDSNTGSTPDQPEGTNPSGTRSSGTPDYLTAAGITQTDPRQDRYNYLRLASFIRPAEVQSAIQFFRARDLDCFGVIDSGSKRRKDGPLYVVFASRGFPSGEADSPEARRYREQILAAGKAWKQAGGVTDFKDAVWALHKK